MFVVVVLSVWVLMHVYVVWRLWSLPFFATPAAHRWIVAATVFLASSFVVARIVEHRGAVAVAEPLEFIGSTWMGVLFLLLLCLLAADLVTAFGLVRSWVVPARTAALAVAAVLSTVALVQGLRPPAETDVTVTSAHLPPDRERLTVVAVSDLHVGAAIGIDWTSRLVDRIVALHPDMVCVVGDLVEGDARLAEPMIPALRRIRAPLGVWAVTGNHEYYAGLETSLRIMQDAGFRVLRDEARDAEPGLVVAGVDDLTARKQFGEEGAFVDRALSDRPPGFTIYLSHTPWEVERAARQGVDLMLSGHTHDGQIWPFGLLVALRYPYLSGHYRIGAMDLFVCRGTGTWGPRMRLWRRGELMRITIERAEAAQR